jgi:nucleotidyltransferase substrate binding protein (TIGR01987 family)
MGKLEKKYTTILKALIALQKSIISYQNGIKVADKTDFYKDVYGEKEEFLNSLRDSMIQRFEFSVDLIWKFLKSYLEEKEKTIPESNTPRSIFRTMCNSKLITEKESETLLDMVSNRNKTSHIYKEEISDFIAKQIPNYYKLMNNIISRIQS